MKFNSVYFDLCRVNLLISKLHPNNAEKSSQTLNKIIEYYGVEAERYILKRLVVAAVKLYREGAAKTQSSVLLTEHLLCNIGHPARLTSIYDALNSYAFTLANSNHQNFSQLIRAFNLKPAHEVALCLLLQEGAEEGVESCEAVFNYAKKTFPQVVESYLETNSNRSSTPGGLQDCTPEILQFILVALTYDNLGINDITKKTFLQRLRLDFPRDLVPVILAPLLYPDDTETPLEDMVAGDDLPRSVMGNPSFPLEYILEVGYIFTQTLERCKEDLKSILSEPTPRFIAQLITFMSNHHSDLPTADELLTPGPSWLLDSDAPTWAESRTWRPEIFGRALKAVVPTLNWKQTIQNLDHPDFFIRDKAAYKMLFSLLRFSLLAYGYLPTTFPVQVFYLPWENREGQLTLLMYLVKYSNIFNLADYPVNPVPIHSLRNQPDVREFVWWSSIDLVQIVVDSFQLGYQKAADLMKHLMQSCPDVMVIAFLNLRDPSISLVANILTEVIPTFLANHPNSTPVLNLLWNSLNPSFKHLILRGMVKWYSDNESDNARISRVLELAQGLNSLPALLNLQEFPFAIDLACLASRRKYLKLDKWLLDKSVEPGYGERFISSIAYFLQKHCIQIIMDHHQRVNHLPLDIANMLFAHLLLYAPRVSPELYQLIKSLATVVTQVRNKAAELTLARFPGYNPQPSLLSMPPIDPVANLTPHFAVQSPSVSQMPPNFPMPPPSMVYNQNPALLPSAAPAQGHLDVMPAPPFEEISLYFSELAGNPGHDAQMKGGLILKTLFENSSPNCAQEILNILIRYFESSSLNDRQVYNYVITNIFQDLKHINEYPDSGVSNCGELVGGLVLKNGISERGMCLVLRYVMHSLQAESNTKLFKFGVTALETFKVRLKEMSTLCDTIRMTPNYRVMPEHLKTFIEAGVVGETPRLPPPSVALPPVPVSGPSSGGSPSKMSTSMFIDTVAVSGRPSVAKASNIDTLLLAMEDDNEKFAPPPEPIQDKTVFIFNNLSQINLAAKADEIKEIVVVEHRPWLSRYIVMKRVSIEAKFHTLYMKFIDYLEWSDLFSLILSETYRNIKILLISDKNLANFSDRTLLKNFGHWLGMMTLGHLKPILYDDLNMKMLILEAFHLGHQELMYVLPFVAKILESCQDNKVFQPPNPWTMSLLNVLAELHSQPDIKLNIKFEIEVLCKTLKVELSSLKPVEFLKEKERLEKEPSQLTNPNKDKDNTSQQSVVNLSEKVEQVMKISQPIVKTPEATTPDPGNDFSIPNPEDVGRLSQLVHVEPFNPKQEPRFTYTEIDIDTFAPFVQHDPATLMFRMFPNVMELVIPNIQTAICDWMSKYKTKTEEDMLTLIEQIILQDFSESVDAEAMHLAVHNFTRNLFCEYIRCTHLQKVVDIVRDKLFTAFTNALSQFPLQWELIELDTQGITTTNAELIGAVAMKAAAEEAIKALDDRLLPEYRAKHKAVFDGKPLPIRSSSVRQYRLPSELREIAARTMGPRMSVYESMSRNVPGFKKSLVPLPFQCSVTALVFDPNKPIVQSTPPAAVASTKPPPESEGLLTVVLQEARRYVQDNCKKPQFEVQTKNISAVSELILHNFANGGKMTGRIVQKLTESLLDGYFLSDSSLRENLVLYRNILINALFQVCSIYLINSASIAAEITKIILNYSEPYRYNLDAISFLMRKGLVNLGDYDCGLVQIIEDGKNLAAVNFAAKLLDIMQAQDKQQSNLDLLQTRAMLRLIHQDETKFNIGATDPVEILKEIEKDEFIRILCSGLSQPWNPSLSPATDVAQHAEMVMVYWVDTLFHARANLDISKVYQLVHQRMVTQGYFNSEDTIARFLRASVVYCTEKTYRNMNEDNNPNIALPALRNKHYELPDALSSLFVCMMMHIGQDDKVPKLRLLNKFLGVVVSCLEKDHIENGALFNPLPYHRIFLNILRELHYSNSDAIKRCFSDVVLSYCYVMYLLRPCEFAKRYFFHWAEFVWNRIFIHCTLDAPEEYRIKTWSMYYVLLVQFLRFSYPSLRLITNSKESKAIRNAVLRVMTLLYHDYPGFLALYRTGLLDEIPLSCCNQIRALVTCAVPGIFKMPCLDTFLVDLDEHSTLSNDPALLINFKDNIVFFKADKYRNQTEALDAYLEFRSPISFLTELKRHLQKFDGSCYKYDLRVLHAVVLYVAVKAIEDVKAHNLILSTSTVSHTASMDVYHSLALNFDDKGRYILFSLMVDNLTYPNSHTYYFRCILLHLFAEVSTLREFICRVLIERLLIKDMVSWGVVYTLGGIVTNTAYSFWQESYIKNFSEIRDIIENGLKKNAWRSK